MGSRRYYIHELPTKLAYLVSTMQNGTRQELQKKTGISHSVFEQVCDESDKAAYSSLGPIHQARLAAACNFAERWPEWRDPLRRDSKQQGLRDTADAFIRKLDGVREQLRKEASNSQHVDDGGAKPASLDAELGAAARASAADDLRLKAGNRPQPEPLTGHIRLGSIEIHATQWTKDTVLLSLTLSCLSWRSLAVRRGSIRLDPGGGRLKEVEGPAWGTPVMVAGSDGKGLMTEVTITRGSGTARDPLWNVESSKGPIGHFRTEGDFAPLAELSPGDKVIVTLGTWLGHVDVSGPDTTSGSSDMDDLTLVDGPLPEEAMVDPKGYKRRLIGIIRKTGLKDVRDCGYVELSRCVLEIALA